jgi:hypothetical protein
VQKTSGHSGLAASLVSLSSPIEDIKLDAVSSLSKEINSGSACIEEFVSDMAGCEHGNPNKSMKVVIPKVEGVTSKSSGEFRKR